MELLVVAGEVLADVQHFVGVVFAGGGWGEGLAVLVEELDRLFDEVAQFGEDLFLVRAVTAAVEQAGAAADEALVVFAPFHDFDVAGCVVHFWDSSIAT